MKFKSLLLAIFMTLAASLASAAPFAYIVNHGGPTSTVSVIDTADNLIKATVALPGNIISGPGIYTYITIGASGQYVYVGLQSGGTNEVLVIDAASNTVVKRIPLLTDKPAGLAVNAAETRLLVAIRDSNILKVIDISTGATEVASVSLENTTSYPEGVVINSDGTKAYVANRGTYNIAEISLDDETNSYIRTALIAIPDSVAPFGLSISTDTVPQLYFSSAFGGSGVVNTATKDVTILNNSPSNAGSFSVSINPVNNTVYIPDYLLYVFDSSRTPLGPYTAATSSETSMGSSVTPDGSKLYLVMNNSEGPVKVYDTANLANTPLLTEPLPPFSYPTNLGNFIGPLWPYAIAASATAPCTIYPAGNVPVNDKGRTFSITGAGCTVKVNGSLTAPDPGTAASYSIKNVTNSSQTIDVIPPLTVTPITPANGSFTPSAAQNIPYNGTTSFTVTPATDYRIASVTGCGGTLTGNTYTTGQITDNCSISATFELVKYGLKATVNSGIGAGGVVTSSPTPGIQCTAGDCTQLYDIHTVVTLTATPDPDSKFEWSGDCTGTATCQVTMDSAKNVTATFASKGLVNPAVTAGKYHNIALKNDGTLWAWGDNSYGQLGDGTTATRSIPVQIGEETAWTDVAAGDFHTIAIKNNGTLWAWGQNSSGQLGDGTTTNRTAPVQIGANSSWVSVAAGGAHSIALRSDGTMWTWGSNSYGQIGNGTTNNSSSPVQVGAEADWADITAGYNFTAAIKQDGTLWAWGNNENSRFGDGTTANASNPVRIGTDTTWKTVAAKSYEESYTYYGRLYALRTDGTLWRIDSSGAVQIGTDNSWEKLVSGKSGVVAVKNSTLWTNGQTQSVSGTGWLDGTSGYKHSVAIKTDGSLWTWGDNGYSQLGTGSSTGSKISPTKIGTATNWQKAVAGNNKTYAIKTDGTLWGWGAAQTQLGAATNWVDVAAEDYFAALDSSGTINSNYGCNGNNGNWLNVSSRNTRVVGVKKNNSLWICNDSYDGISTSEPKQIDWSWNWASVAAGEVHTVAIKTDGTLWAWGYNTYGQLGDGTGFTRATAVKIGTDTNWKSVVAGDYYTVALKKDGTLWAWGRNNVGQLANETVLDKNTPSQIGIDKDWQTISAGATHVMALKSDGTLWGWGGNSLNQVGDDTDQNKTKATQIGSDKDWASVSAGTTHTMAVKKDGTLWAWGSNSDGQHGDWATLKPGPPYNIMHIGKIVPTYNLTVHKTGTGAGQITASKNQLFWSAGTGTANLAQDTIVTLTATPGTTDTFAGWSGACIGTAPTCAVTMIEAKETTAIFNSIGEPCGTPASISSPTSATFNDNSSHTVSWESSPTPGATYVLTENGAVIYTGEATSFVVNNRSHATYRYRVKATKSGFADSSFTDPSDTTIKLVCAPVTGLTAPASSSDGNFTISWVPSTTSGASHYIRSSNSFISANVDAVTSYTLTNAPENHTFWIDVTVSKQGYIPATHYIMVNIDYPDVGAIASISSPAQSPDGNYTVSWSASATPGVTYNLYENCSSFNTDGTCWYGGRNIYSGSSTSFNVTKSIPSQTGFYDYRVVATRAGYTPAYTGQVTTRAGLYAEKPSYITAPATVNSVTGDFTVSWGSSPTPGVTYVLYLDTFLSPLYEGQSTSYRVVGAGSGTYSFRVKAKKDGYVTSALTSPSTTQVALTCATPTNLVVPAASLSGSYQISWSQNAPVGATYVLTENGTTIYTGTNTTFNVTGRGNGTYIYQVRATKADFNDSPATPPVSTKVTLTCIMPTGVTTPSSSIDGNYKVSWNASQTPGATYVLTENGAIIYTGTNTFYTFTGKGNGTYSYQLKATKTGYSNSPATLPVSTRVTLTCIMPAGMTTPSSSIDGNYQVSWTASRTPGVTYVLTENGTIIYSGTNTFYSFTGKGNGTYSYQLKATKTGFSDSPVTLPVSTKVILTCVTPTGIFTPSNNTSGNYQITWNASRTAGVTYVLTENGATIYTGTNTFFTFTNKGSGTYTYQLKAIKASFSDSPVTMPVTTRVTR